VTLVPKYVTPQDPEQIPLAAAYHHFLALGPSPERARIDLIAAMREGRLDLSAEVVTELFNAPKYPPGAQPPPPRVTRNAPIPEAALQPCPEGGFDLERSRLIWRNSATGSLVTFESITLSRDQVLALRPAPTDAEPKRRRGGGRKAQFDWDQIHAHICHLIYEDGWPEHGDLREFAKKICDVCTEAGMQLIPDPETVRKKLTIFLDVRRSALEKK
jgi:hypothetical protein